MAVAKYYIDGIDIKSSYGVCVEKSKGLISMPKPKEPKKVSRGNENGVQIMSNKKYYEEREISLKCFISATSPEGLVSKVNSFVALMDKFPKNNADSAMRELRVDVGQSKPLVYEVYLSDSIDVDKVWRDGKMVGEFELKLKEAEPIKRIFSIDITNARLKKVVNLKLKCSTNLNVYWGDGSVTYDTNSDVNREFTYQHIYNKGGKMYVVLTGDITSIVNSTLDGGELVWERL